MNRHTNYIIEICFKSLAPNQQVIIFVKYIQKLICVRLSCPYVRFSLNIKALKLLCKCLKAAVVLDYELQGMGGQKPFSDTRVKEIGHPCSKLKHSKGDF